MKQENIDKIYQLLDNIQVTSDNQTSIDKIHEALENEDYLIAFTEMQQLLKKEKMVGQNKKKSSFEDENNVANDENEQNNEYDESKENNFNEYDEHDKDLFEMEHEEEEEEEENLTKQTQISRYPSLLRNNTLEMTYIGLLLNNPKAITKYYFPHEICYFDNDDLLNLYKSILYTEAANYTPEPAKKGFNFAKEDGTTYDLKFQIKNKTKEKKYDIEEIYVSLKKVFLLRKAYTEEPIQETQNKIVEIANYELYEQMTAEEIESAIKQVYITGKFKQAILNQDLTSFLENGDNNLRNGLPLPFPILSQVFKGIRKGETMAVAMPSNSGKSRFTINLAAYTALVEKKKVLIISNEMSEDKMRLCLLTTIVNHPEIQKIHGKKLHKTEGELLEFKFRPDEGKEAKLDEKGFILPEENESRPQFVKRLTEISTEFKDTIEVTKWINQQMNNAIHFINITDHTNEELRNVIMNYYYKEQVEYIFYDTLKTDTENIGNGEELKKTATILSNLAQNFNLFICSTLQLTETTTLPINLTINDLAVSRTVKEVLDTLCLIKQIHRDHYTDYEYSLEEVDTKFYDLKKEKDPDVRYYACVVDKNRAGAKPKVVFRLNLAYNSWQELGYLRLKQSDEEIESK